MQISFVGFQPVQSSEHMAVSIPYQAVGPHSLVVGELTLNSLGFSPLWLEPRSGHMWESQVLLMDGQVVFLGVLRFSPTFDERSARSK